MAETKYVRLADRLARACLVDIVGGTGWSIAGLDVVEFPTDNDRAAEFVRLNLARGNLEAASKAEFEEVMENNSRDFLAEAGIEVEPHKVEGFYQEGHVVGAADETRRRIEASRGLGTGVLSYKEDLVRRQRLVDAQSAYEDAEDGAELDEDIQPDPVSPLGRQLVGGDPEKGGAGIRTTDPEDDDGEMLDEDEDDDEPKAPKKRATSKKAKSSKGSKRAKKTAASSSDSGSSSGDGSSGS